MMEIKTNFSLPRSSLCIAELDDIHVNKWAGVAPKRFLMYVCVIAPRVGKLTGFMKRLSIK